MKSKQKYGIVAGEDIDMPSDYISKHGITQYEFNLSWDGVLKNRKDIYKKMQESLNKPEAGTPRTSQPSAGVLNELFQKELKSYEELFVVTLSSKLSGCYNSAIQAKEMLDEENRSKIHIIESPSSTCGSAFLMRKLVEMIEKEASVKEILSNLDVVKQQTRLVAMIEDSYWLQKGGRMSPAIGMIVNQMKKINLRPLLTAKDGKIALLNVRTNVQDKVQALVQYLEKEISETNVELVITHADNIAEADILKKSLQKKSNIKLLYVNQLSPVLGAHLGPYSLVVAWKAC
ncbi:MAG: DegV family protein [Patescibacteria group bacterium]